MPIYFCNSEPMDLLAIEIMGLSVKTPGSSPIGYFGTGLKFAIATLLRTGHEIVIEISGVKHSFELEKKILRGVEFSQVVLVNDVFKRPLGFTTELGKNWSPWMAFRELHSNVLDEGGETKGQRPSGKWGTLIEVTGAGIEEAFLRKDEIFLPKEDLNLLAANDDCEVYDKPSSWVYYRGVRVSQLPIPSRLTFNLVQQITLTEDRTMAYPWMLPNVLAPVVMRIEDEEVLEKILLSKEGKEFGEKLQFPANATIASKEFKEVVKRNKRNVRLNESALFWWQGLEENQNEEIDDDEAMLSIFEEEEIERAIQVLKVLGEDISRKDFVVVKSLGPDILGLHKRGKSFIAKGAIEAGVAMLAGTIFEECIIHGERGLGDLQRNTQNFLINRLMQEGMKKVANGEV